jgi:hypothetical protein
MALSIMAECCYAVSFMLTVVYAECRKLALYADCRYAECSGASNRNLLKNPVHVLCPRQA